MKKLLIGASIVAFTAFTGMVFAVDQTAPVTDATTPTAVTTTTDTNAVNPNTTITTDTNGTSTTNDSNGAATAIMPTQQPAAEPTTTHSSTTSAE